MSLGGRPGFAARVELRAARFFTRVMATAGAVSSSADLWRMLQVQAFPVAANDARPYGRRAPALLRHLPGVDRLGHAGAAVGAVRRFEAGVQAGVAMRAVAVAITRHLVDHGRHPRSSLVRRNLQWIGE